MGTIKITSDSMLKAKIEKLEDFGDSFMLKQYIDAAKILNEIIDNSNAGQDRNNDIALRSDDYNNIIVFTGERGTGKSSCMLSFTNSLVDKNAKYSVNKIEDKYKELKDEYEKIHNEKSYLDLETIDPSAFNGNDSLIEIVVARMFEKFSKNNKYNDANKSLI